MGQARNRKGTIVNESKSGGGQRQPDDTGPAPHDPMRRGLRRGLLLVIVIILVAGAVLVVRWMDSYEALRDPASEIHAAFTLTDQDGQQVAAADLAGKPMLLYFGFTYCPDICPIELSNISDVLDLLGERAGEVNAVFITVDPERDTPPVMRDYLAHFHENIIGLTGTPEQIAQAARAAKVYYARVETPGSAAGYLVDHTGFVYLLDTQGRYAAHFRPAADPQEIAGRVAELL